MAISLEGQVALVTGSGRGLGRSYAMDLARRGAKVVINDLGGAVDGSGSDLSPADQVVAEIKAAGGQAIANRDSVTSYEGGYNMVKAAMDEWGRLDIVICNAGILRDLAFHNMSEQDWDAVIATHMKGCYTVLHAAWPVFRQQSYGRVVMATSSSGLYGNFGQANYSAAKLGIVGLMNTLKFEGDKYNVMVNCIAPVAATRMTENILPKEALAAMSPEHVVPAVTYMCSSECTTSGMTIEAGAGGYNRTALIKGPQVKNPDGQVKDAEWFGDNFAAISSLEGGQVMWGGRETYAQHYEKKAQA